MKVKFALFALGLVLGGIYFSKGIKRQGKMRTLSRQEVLHTPFHYGVLAEGFRKGQLSLAVEPSRELLAIKNPYVLSSRKFVSYVWDASLYKGKYFIYFSPVPVLLFHLPASFLFDAYPDPAWALILFLSLFTFFLFLSVRELYGDSENVPAYAWFFLLALFALGNGGIPALDYATWYVLAISCGSMWTAFALYWAVRILKRGPTVTSCAAWGAGTVMAFWSRPSQWLLFLVPFVFLGFVFTRRATVSRKQLAAFTGASLIGLSLIGTYNYLRFDSPFDYGVDYQLSIQETPLNFSGRSVATLLSLQREVLPLFLLSFPHWNPQKKSLQLDWYNPKPLGRIENALNTEPMIGLLAFCPFFLLGLLSLPVLCHREMRKRNVAWLSAWLFTIGILLLLFFGYFGAVAARYLMDMTPYFLLAAAIQWFEWLSLLSPRGRTVLNVTACSLCTVSIVVGLLL